MSVNNETGLIESEQNLQKKNGNRIWHEILKVGH